MSHIKTCAPQAGCPRQGIERRAILRLGAAAGSAVLVLPLGCGQGAAAEPSGPIAAGNVAGVAVDSLTVLHGDNAVLGRDAGGLYAMSAVCTHAGCVVSALATVAAGLDCGCHNSRFDRNGTVTAGPARASLQHYQVDLAADGSLTIQGAIPVDSSARTPVT